MKIRFEVDQAEAFRQGIDCPKSIVTVEVNPSELEPEKRSLLADRLQGIDVLELFWYDGAVQKGYPIKELEVGREPQRIVASAPTFEALMAAVRQSAQVIESIRRQFRTRVPMMIISEPPPNENEFYPVKCEAGEDVRPWLEKGHRIVFEDFIDDVQTKLNEVLNAKHYRVSLLPIPADTAQGRFYCERVFSATLSTKHQVVGHGPIVVYNEKTGRVADAAHLFHALDIYLLDGATPGKNINDLNILRWQWPDERWTIITPELILQLIDEAKEKAKKKAAEQAIAESAEEKASVS
jgi:hypothetical protein